MTINTSLFHATRRLRAVLVPLALLGGCDFDLPEPEEPPMEPPGETSGGPYDPGDCELALDECLADPALPEEVCIEIFEGCLGGGDGGPGDDGGAATRRDPGRRGGRGPGGLAS